MKKILLVEDDPFLIDIYSTKLKEAGFSVKNTADGEEAIKMAQEEKPDLVVLDIVLPQIDGWEILKRLKEDLNLKSLKVIILSNLGQKEEVKKGIEMGAVAYLIKAHYTPSQMVEEITKVLEK